MRNPAIQNINITMEKVIWHALRKACIDRNISASGVLRQLTLDQLRQWKEEEENESKAHQ